MSINRRKTILYAALPVVAASLLILVWLFFASAVQGPADTLYTLSVNRGDSFEDILTRMQNAGMSESKTRLRLVAWLSGLHTQVKAGVYEVRGGTSSIGLLKQLQQGRVKVVRVMIPEGKHARQIAGILQRTIQVDSTAFVTLCQDSSFAGELGLPTASLEGVLFPDTYYFSVGMSPEKVVRTMAAEFARNFDDSLRSRAAQLGFSMTETLTLASIIEGEAVVAEERKTIAGVYHNRLRRGMRLQADPTIQYIVEDGPRRLLRKDLEIDSPFNTYKYSGLPPGPINNPGLNAIIACLYPEKVSYLYFVANGDGSHTFSTTLSEHLQAKAKFDRHRKKVRREAAKNNG
jgi:UPF0755 protein